MPIAFPTYNVYAVDQNEIAKDFQFADVIEDKEPKPRHTVSLLTILTKITLKNG